MAARVALLLALVASVSAQNCGNKIDMGTLPPPWEGFGNCAEAAAIGMCDDPAVSDAIVEGCKLACDACPAGATELAPQKCPFTLTITSGTWAEEISFIIDPDSDSPITGPQSPIGNYATFTKVS